MLAEERSQWCFTLLGTQLATTEHKLVSRKTKAHKLTETLPLMSAGRQLCTTTSSLWSKSIETLRTDQNPSFHFLFKPLLSKNSRFISVKTGRVHCVLIHMCACGESLMDRPDRRGERDAVNS